MSYRIAVVGCGPKAVAIAAKCAALRLHGYEAPTLEIFESEGVGAAWSGVDAFSNGNSLLCTSADRDLGFPYSDPVFGEIDSTMRGLFSWRSFLSSGLAEFSLNDWMSRNCPAPSHQHFARYLLWAFNQATELHSGIGLTLEEVVRISHNGASWVVSSGSARAPKVADNFDGVVITGSLERTDLLLNAPEDYSFNGVNFWHSRNTGRLLGELRRRTEGGDRS